MRSDQRSRRAFSLIEVLVVIGIVGMLAGLLIVGVVKVNEAASRATCTNNLHQLTIGMHLFHDTYGTFPTSGGGLLASHSPETTRGWTYQGFTIHFGLPDPNQPPHNQRGSWPYTILPYIEQAEIFWDVRYDARIPIYACPVRRSCAPQTCPGTDPVMPGITYYPGSPNLYCKTDYSANGRLIQCYPFPTTSIDMVTSGTSNTVMFGEKSLDPRMYNTGGWYWDEPAFMGCNVRGAHGLNMDRVGVPFENNWGSAHPTSANFAFVDGSVRPVKYGTTTDVLVAMQNPWAGGNYPQIHHHQ